MKIECDRCSKLYSLEKDERILISLCPSYWHAIAAKGLVTNWTSRDRGP